MDKYTVIKAVNISLRIVYYDLFISSFYDRIVGSYNNENYSVSILTKIYASTKEEAKEKAAPFIEADKNAKKKNKVFNLIQEI